MENENATYSCKEPRVSVIICVANSGLFLSLKGCK